MVFILEQYEGLSARAMMGEFILYYSGKVIGGVCDWIPYLISLPLFYISSMNFQSFMI